MWMWERGAGRTRACGSGACAVAFAFFAAKEGEEEEARSMVVSMEGGELLVSLDGEGKVSHRGGAVFVFSGRYRMKL